MTIRPVVAVVGVRRRQCEFVDMYIVPQKRQEKPLYLNDSSELKNLEGYPGGWKQYGIRVKGLYVGSLRCSNHADPLLWVLHPLQNVPRPCKHTKEPFRGRRIPTNPLLYPQRGRMGNLKKEKKKEATRWFSGGTHCTRVVKSCLVCLCVYSLGPCNSDQHRRR